MIYLSFLKDSCSSQCFTNSSPSSNITQWSFSQFHVIYSRIFLWETNRLSNWWKSDFFLKFQKTDIVSKRTWNEFGMNNFIFDLDCSSTNIIRSTIIFSNSYIQKSNVWTKKCFINCHSFGKGFKWVLDGRWDLRRVLWLTLRKLRTVTFILVQLISVEMFQLYRKSLTTLRRLVHK